MAEPGIVGVGESGLGRVPDRSSMAMHVDALAAACSDADIEFGEIDGLVTCDSMVEPYPRHAMVLGEQLGILHRLKTVDTVHMGGASPVLAVQKAIDEVRSGRCSYVAIVTADPQLSGLSRDRAIEVMASFRHPEYEGPYGPTNPTCFALLANRYEREFGDVREAMTEVAVSSRSFASVTPGALMTEPITAADVEQSKMISSPLRKLDCSLITDGGGCVIVGPMSKANGSAVAIAGSGRGFASHDHISKWDGSFLPERLGAKQSFTMAAGEAGIRHDDVDIAYLYDCFTITPPFLLEQLGFCSLGEATDFIKEKGIRRDGRLPLNTHGGLLSFGHSGYPSTIFALIEATRQLSRAVGANRAVPGNTAVVHGLGGMFSVHATLILDST